MIASAVIFDMDGLLLDSEREILDCWRATATAQSLTVDDSLWLSMVGLHEAGCAELLERLLGMEATARLTKSCHEEYERRVARGLPLKSGTRELLQDLSDLGVPMAVATSTRGDRARLKLASCGLDGYFRHVVTSSDVEHAKPAPDLYLLAAERLGVPAIECVALEDSEYGVRAASAAGLRVIQVPDLVPATELSESLASVVVSLEAARPLLESCLQIVLPRIASSE